MIAPSKKCPCALFTRFCHCLRACCWSVIRPYYTSHVYGAVSHMRRRGHHLQASSPVRDRQNRLITCPARLASRAVGVLEYLSFSFGISVLLSESSPGAVFRPAFFQVTAPVYVPLRKFQLQRVRDNPFALIPLRLRIDANTL